MIIVSMLLGFLALSVPLSRKIYLQTRRKYLSSLLAVGFLSVLGLVLSILGVLFGLMFAGGQIGDITRVGTVIFEDVLIAAFGALMLRWVWDYFHNPSADDMAEAQLSNPEVNNF